MSRIVFMVFYLWLIAGTSFAGEITVSAAASLKDTFLELQEVFERENPGIRIYYNFASSGLLSKQIEMKAPVDLFACADVKHMEALIDKGLVDRNSVNVFAGNTMVLIVPGNGVRKITGWDDLLKAQKISIGNPGHAPVGIYAKEVLCKLGLWNKIELKLVYGNQVRQVLEYVAQGMVDAGIVYKTDVPIAKKRIKAIAQAPPHVSPLIAYTVGLVSFSKNKNEAERFKSFLLGKEGKAVLKKYGFEHAENTIQ